MAFESKDDVKKQNEMSNGLKKRNPVGNVNNRVFEREKMKEEVERYPDGIAVNWSDLARRHNRELKHVGREHDGDGNQYNESMKRNK
jgi:hypothetical protein